MRVEVVYALPAEQVAIELDVAAGTTAGEAVVASGLGERFSTSVPDNLNLAIFSRVCAHDAVLRPGDRIEILRPLELDPREARRRRAASKR
ncbi:MAG: RnfH family protein [Halofilum sp. (in: g-proteobacteria)]